MRIFSALAVGALMTAVIIGILVLLQGCVVAPAGLLWLRPRTPVLQRMEILMRALMLAVAALAVVAMPGMAANAKDLLTVTMSATISGGARPIVTGRTNLPDGMKLVVELAHPCDQDLERRFLELDRGHYFPTCINQLDVISADAVVAKGQFRTGPWGYDHAAEPPGLPVTPGQYVLYIFSLDLLFGTPEVRAVTGEEGQNLAGPLINRYSLSAQVKWYTNVTVR
jgi:hypothetical protein